MEVSLVFDISDSMEASGSIPALERALERFVDNPVFTSANENAVFSLIPYANSVAFSNVHTSWINPIGGYDYSPTFQGCFMPDFADINTIFDGQPIAYAAPQRFNNHGSPLCPSQNMAAQFFISDSRDVISMVRNIESANGTGTNEALTWGYRSLIPSSAGAFAGNTKFPRSFSPENKKILILLTDGKPVNKMWLEKEKLESEESEEMFHKTCETIKSSGHELDVYMIGFGTLKRSGKDLKKLLEDCTLGRGYFISANQQTLGDTLSDIISGYNNVALVK